MNTADVGSDGSVDLTYKFDAIGRRVFRDNGTTASIYVQAGLLPLEKWNDVLMILWLRLAWFVLFVVISLIPSAWYSFQWITRSYRYSHTLSVFFPVLVAEFVAICGSSAILLRFKSQNTSYFVIAMNCVVAALVSAFAFATFRFRENAN